MNKLIILLLAGIFIIACADSQQENKSEESVSNNSDSSVNSGPRKLENVKTSELATLMRLMDAEMQSAKISIEGGYSFHDSLTFDYAFIHSAKPTEDKMKKSGFEDFASAYLKQVELLKNSSAEKQKENYNLLINSCLNCHTMHCPGPVNKIKELRIKS